MRFIRDTSRDESEFRLSQCRKTLHFRLWWDCQENRVRRSQPSEIKTFCALCGRCGSQRRDMHSFGTSAEWYQFSPASHWFI